MSSKRWLILVLGLFFLHWITDPTYARTLEEIKKSGEIRLCVAGSSYDLYTKTGTVFAKSLGVKANVKKIDSWDKLFHNKKGKTDKNASYTPYLMENEECDFYPNDLVINEWRLRMMDFAVYLKPK